MSLELVATFSNLLAAHACYPPFLVQFPPYCPFYFSFFPELESFGPWLALRLFPHTDLSEDCFLAEL